MKKILSILTVLMFSLNAFAQKHYESDAAHSRIGFSIIHMGINDISGNFDKSNVMIDGDINALQNAKINFNAEAASINTQVEKRDEHLRNADFFDAATYPKIAFSSTSIKPAKKNYYEMKGNLLMHGVTKPVTLVLVYRGSSKNMSGKTVHGLQVLGTLKRSDFGIGGKFPEAVLSDNVRIKGDFEITEK